MNEIKELLTTLLKSNNITVLPERRAFVDRFLQDEKNNNMMKEIVQKTNKLMENWKLEERIRNVMEQSLRIPNGTVGKGYEAPFDVAQSSLKDVVDFEWRGLEQVGLFYDADQKKIKGTPTESGDIELSFLFKVQGQNKDMPFSEKPVTLIINPDPKSLWKNIASDKDDPYWKEDNVTVFAPLGDRHILVSSKRGRSHANVGSFREDDFAFQYLANGWSIVVVADGAGSAKISRKGSALACTGVIEFFSEPSAIENLNALDGLFQEYINAATDQTQKKINRFVYDNLGKAAFNVHKKLETFAAGEGFTLKELSTTLIFTLFKKYQPGYVLLSFGVGDCPIAVLNKDVSEVTLMNWIDVGEYGGGTRFITMPEIFQSEKFATRFGFKYINDFAYLVLMSDGIYDPKFVVEAALPEINKWREFLADIKGNNPEGNKVELDVNNAEIEKQFSAWMDFWSPGNHDDRTLAIVF
jgi:serine/threonine protein phosphatase PrpC